MDVSERSRISATAKAGNSSRTASELDVFECLEQTKGEKSRKFMLTPNFMLNFILNQMFQVGITNMDQLREHASETPSTMSLPSSTSGGGGKVRAAKKTRERPPRAQPPSEEFESESCLESLASVPKLSFNPANFPR